MIEGKESESYFEAKHNTEICCEYLPYQ